MIGIGMENYGEAAHRFCRLTTPEMCMRLQESLGGQKFVALWATVVPRQNVDILLELESRLRERGVPVLFFLKENAVEFVGDSAPGRGDFLILEDKGLLRHLPGIGLLVTHDYVVGHSRVDGFHGKTMLLNHSALFVPHAGIAMDLYADYLVTVNAQLPETLDFSFVPHLVSMQHNPQLAVIPAGSPKLDLLAAARRKAYARRANILSFYPASSDVMLGTPAKAAAAVREWSNFVECFFRRHPGWTFVFSPALYDHGREFILDFVETWRSEKRFVFSKRADNKYWLARSDFLLTDWSTISLSWAFSSLRPAICLRPGAEEKEIGEDAFGYIAGTGRQALEALGLASENLWRWKARLLKFRTEQIPTFGRSFAQLADAIRHILSTEFPKPLPGWVIMDKKVGSENPVHDLLRRYSRRKANPSGHRTLHPGHHWDKALASFRNGPLALAALDELLAWFSVRGAASEFDMARWKSYTVSALALTPQKIVYSFIYHKLSEYRENQYSLSTLAVVAASADGTSEQRETVGRLLRKGNADIRSVAEFFHACRRSGAQGLSEGCLGQILSFVATVD